MDPIAKTSLLVAAVRAQETETTDPKDRLFIDPFAKRLAGSVGLSMLAQAEAEAGHQPAVILRTRYMDDHVTGALARGIRQVVILAAGMDARAWRLAFPQGTKLYELDRPDVLAYKQEKLKGAKPGCTRIEIAVDLSKDWPRALKEAGMDPSERTLWLAEGLLMYLDEGAVVRLFEQVSAVSVTGSLLLCDVLGRSLLNAPHMEKQLAYLKKLGAPWRFGTDEPEAFMAQFGWAVDATLPYEVAPHRWPYPTAPRSAPGVPRSFFCEARKG